MQQVRIFKTVESEVTELAQQINAWIEESGARVLSITGNIAPQSAARTSQPASLGGSTHAVSDVLVIVLYETAEG